MGKKSMSVKTSVISANSIRGYTVGRARIRINKKGEAIPIEQEIVEINCNVNNNNIFLFYSNFFLNSADILKESILEEGMSYAVGNVATYLYLHGLELKIKGVLFNIDNKRKTSSQFGRDWGHDLNNILEELKSKGVNWDYDLTSKELKKIYQMGKDYRYKLYNYADDIDKDRHLLIDPEETMIIVSKVLKNISHLM